MATLDYKNHGRAGPQRRRWGLVLALFLVGGICFVSWKYILPMFRASLVEPVEPPALDEVNVDKAVTDAVTTARETVLASPEDGKLWGELGSIYLAHDFNSHAATCLDQAARLDPDDARWPYLHARSL